MTAAAMCNQGGIARRLETKQGGSSTGNGEDELPSTMARIGIQGLGFSSIPLGICKQT